MEEEEDDGFVTSLSFGDGIELRMVWLRDEMEGIGNMERDNFLASYLRHVFVSFAPSPFFLIQGESITFVWSVSLSVSPKVYYRALLCFHCFLRKVSLRRCTRWIFFMFVLEEASSLSSWHGVELLGSIRGVEKGGLSEKSDR